MSQHAAKIDQIRSLLNAGRAAQAQPLCQRLVQAAPREANAHYLMSQVLLAQGQTARALHFAGTASTLAPREVSLLLHLASLQGIENKSALALESLELAERIAPEDAAILGAQVGVLLELNQCTRAYEVCGRALRIAPGDPGLGSQLVACLLNLGRVEEAFDSMRPLAAAHPNDLTIAGGLALLSNYHSGVGAGERLEYHRAYGRIMDGAVPRRDRAFLQTRDPSRRLRIGLVSPDLRGHSVAWFVEPLLEHHDPARIEFVVYQTNFVADAVTARLRALCEQWRVMDRVNDAQLAEAIHEDRVDILIELSGHTHAHSLGAMQLRPAPVQMTYLGYPNTTGLTTIDYRIVDSQTDPAPGADALATERLLRLDPCFLCYKPPVDAALPGPLPAHGAGHVTFGSFNNAQKLNRVTVAMWSRVLQAVPGSRLLLKSVAFVDAALRADVAARFSGIDPSRIEILSRAPSVAEHLALYNRIDIGLDPRPYCGTTTTCEALWMGVPVITLRGDSHASNVGASLLSAAGLREMITSTEEEYIECAAALARDLSRLGQIRASLRGRMASSPLCDAAGFAQRFEALMRLAWAAWCGGATPTTQ